MTAPVRQLFPDGHVPDVEPPNPTEVLPAPSDPLAVARVLLDELTEDGQILIRRWRGEWWRYQGPHWAESETEAVRKWLYLRLERAVYRVRNRDGEWEQRPWAPDKGKVDKLIDAMAAPTLIPKAIDAPSWLDTGTSAAGLVPCTNGLVDVTTKEIRPCTPNYFGTVGVPFAYDPDAPPPVEWAKFLRTLWPDVDGQLAPEIHTLQEWFGYVLSGRLDLQKMLLLVGPPRSGKGTIARILTELIGRANTAAPTLAGMASNFGMAPLIGKSLGIVGDARLQSQGQEAVVERLLSISGQDSITVDRKNREAWTGTIGARLMILSNELPRFGDASGAVASRFVILTLEKSFLGTEDIELGDRLHAELPAILAWALDGLRRLDTQRRLTEPPRSAEAVQELADLVSPISTFIREACDLDPDSVVPFADVYREYGEWCRENGRGVASSAKFSADLRTRIPGLQTDYRPRDDAGRRLPRHVRGLGISSDWKNRVKPWGDNWHMGT